MADPRHLEIVRRGTSALDEWCAENPGVTLKLEGANLRATDLRGAKLGNADLRAAKLTNANLSNADLSGANLVMANLNRANLSQANLSQANLRVAILIGANLSGASLRLANLQWAKLIGANLHMANLSGANLSRATLINANLSEAIMAFTVLGNVDLSTVNGLDSVMHTGPSTLGIDSAVKSRGAIPEIFLRGCGVPDIFIQYIGSLTNQPRQYYSCFISFSTKDQDFAQRLHNDLQAKGVRCWFAPHDIQAGKKLHEQIEDAIRVYDKLLLILSPNSMASEWVKTEIAKARKREIAQDRRMLFPVRLVNMDALQGWECFDADTGKDSAREIREYYIPDFSEWETNRKMFNREFTKLLRDLKSDARQRI